MNRHFLLLNQRVGGGEEIAIFRFIKALRHNKHIRVYVHNPTVTIEKKILFGFFKSHWHAFLETRSIIRQELQKHAGIKYIFVSDYLSALTAVVTKPVNVKLIFLFHGLRSIIFRKFSDINYREVLVKMMERICWIFSDVVVVPSESALTYLQRKVRPFPIQKKIFVVPNIIPPGFFARQKWLNHGTLLYSGRLVRYKGLENLVTAISLLDNIKLMLAYPAHKRHDDTERVLRRLVGDFRIKKKLVFIKNPSKKELTNLYRKVDALILPSEIEVAPLSVLESMACGTPVIATKVGNIEDLIGRVDPGLLLDSNSVEEIVRVISRFYKFSEKRKINIAQKELSLAKYYSEKEAADKFSKVLDYLR
jgi:glycosyltransferase involved in cell wall biosynthesis